MYEIHTQGQRTEYLGITCLRTGQLIEYLEITRSHTRQLLVKKLLHNQTIVDRGLVNVKNYHILLKIFPGSNLNNAIIK